MSWLPASGFAQFDRLILGYSEVIGAYGVGLYCVLCAHADRRTGRCYPSIALLSEELRVSQNTVRKTLRRMEGCGMIEMVERKENNRPASYGFRMLPLSPSGPSPREGSSYEPSSIGPSPPEGPDLHLLKVRDADGPSPPEGPGPSPREPEHDLDLKEGDMYENQREREAPEALSLSAEIAGEGNPQVNPQVNPSPSGDLRASVVALCALSPAILSPLDLDRLSELVDRLSVLGLTPSQVAAFRPWMDKYDWPTRKGGAPTLAQVGNTERLSRFVAYIAEKPNGRPKAIFIPVTAEELAARDKEQSETNARHRSERLAAGASNPRLARREARRMNGTNGGAG